MEKNLNLVACQECGKADGSVTRCVIAGEGMNLCPECEPKLRAMDMSYLFGG